MVSELIKMGDVYPEFDEAGYLSANRDVALAVEAGIYASGAEHYARHGVRENRRLNRKPRPAPLKLPFPKNALRTRRDKILGGLDLTALDGLEIGALDAPLITPDEGRIFFVDHAGTEFLKQKYRAEPSVNSANIVDVGAVWGSQTLQQCIGASKKVDYVVASHVIEHVPDLITWLAEIRSILRPGGTLRLAIPDRRFTFDFLRYESRTHDVVDAYLRRARAPLPRQIMEHCNLTRIVDCRAAWKGALDIANLRSHYSLSDGVELARNALIDGAYHDVHCWVFTPLSFALLCTEMAQLGLMGFACACHFETVTNELEFFIHMTPHEDNAEIVASWQKMTESLSRRRWFALSRLTKRSIKSNISRYGYKAF
jgi:SAM-dependent methyltransferase